LLRIVSLLPSATEIVCVLGARDDLAGVSHECDWPHDVVGLPVLTRAKMMPSPSSLAIDRSVRDVVRQALAVYDIDTALLERISPDAVVTQDLCDVCAVSLTDVQSAVARLANRDVTIVSLRPERLRDIFTDIERTGTAIGRAAEATRVVASLLARVEGVRARAAAAVARPTVLTIEWLEPVMVGGMWMPELITIAGGTPLVTAPGERAPTLSLASLARLDPDVVLVKPCGFTLERTVAELEALPRVLPWSEWRCVREGRVFLADGNAYFNRPGPRIVDSLEILSACVHPEIFADHRARYPDAVLRVSPDLRTHPW
jgi:iron complex transport system substrate-binding protein